MIYDFFFTFPGFEQQLLDRIEEEESIVPAKEKFRYEHLEQIQSGDFEESDVSDILKYESMFDSFKTTIPKLTNRLPN